VGQRIRRPTEPGDARRPDGLAADPRRGKPARYGDCRLPDGSSYRELLERLGISTIRGPRGGTPVRRLPVEENPGVHLDPDLVAGCRPRPLGWRPLFGQVGAPQSHLANQGVGPGDLFLFFGWFCPVEEEPGGHLRYRSARERVQSIWGWMEIGEVLPATQATEVWPWARGHPHLLAASLARYRRNNTLYAAAPNCRWASGHAGAGVFSWSDRRRLTKVGSTPRVWSLPECLHPLQTGMPLTGQGVDAWARDGQGRVTLRSACIGQEFVVVATPEIERWVAELFDQ
jgi:hypothetical protein